MQLRQIIAFSFAIVALPAQALVFNFINVNNSLTADQFNSVQNAANYYVNNFSDPVTVNIRLVFANLGSCEDNCAFARTSNSTFGVGYDILRQRLIADGKTSTDQVATSHLPPGPFIEFQATNANGTERFDNDKDIPAPPFNDSNNYFINLSVQKRRRSVQSQPIRPQPTLH